MRVIHARGVNEALPSALLLLAREGNERNSRNGPVLAFDEPVTTVYSHPRERVLFSPMRRANPVFHLLESLWMLAGRNDVAFPSTLVKNMRSFTDDGKTYHGAYGYRWREHFGHDQLDWIIRELRGNPDSRRAVLQMWDGKLDPMMAQQGGKDVPCNTAIYFDRRGDKLNMLVSCRSNDMIWGAYGANAVHMSVLQEYLAYQIGVPMGTYRQVSNDLHLYLDKYKKRELYRLAEDCERNNYYTVLNAQPLFHGSSAFEISCDMHYFFNWFDRRGLYSMVDAHMVFQTDLFNRTVLPMTRAWALRKVDPDKAQRVAATIQALDWRYAVSAWLGGGTR